MDPLPREITVAVPPGAYLIQLLRMGALLLDLRLVSVVAFIVAVMLSASFRRSVLRRVLG